ncbi:MAG: arginine--tRNA ligase [Pseudomonadales bacterium]|nr:arginine--tRNA ligase [Pseudomonadales bacterium]
MKQKIAELIEQAVADLIAAGSLPEGLKPRIQIDNTKDKSHGELASNIAMMLAKPARKSPRELATLVVDALPESQWVEKVEIAGPGFINFFLTDQGGLQVVHQIIEQKEQFGRSTVGAGAKLQVEFVSANPTGPLHVGHGRGAAYGETLSNLLEAIGYQVDREYYVNDAGRQMDILATSVWLRYLQQSGQEITFPSNAYKGDYVIEFADQLVNEYSSKFVHVAEDVMQGICDDEPAGGDKEKHIDQLIERAKKLLGTTNYRTIFDYGLDHIRDDIKQDLEEFGIEYQGWFSERAMMETGKVESAIEQLQERGFIYEKDGALWFKSTDFGDGKDRVVQRDNGQPTYFASDIAYHLNKFQRGYKEVINIWGADHHGYMARVKAALKALGEDPERLKIRLVQFAILYHGKERLSMSTRSGSFVTLRELREEVGNDAARFFYVTRKVEQHMDFDLELAKSQSKDNPVYYIQFAHARIASVQKKLKDEGLSWNSDASQYHLERLIEPQEKALINKLALYSETILKSAEMGEPHQLVNYLRELAGIFHGYYTEHKVLVENQEIRNARLTLYICTGQIIHNGLTLLGVSAPDSM